VTFNLPDDDPRYAAAWKYLLTPAEFAGAAGPRTADPSYPDYIRQ
jgi:hypothetical protein